MSKVSKNKEAEWVKEYENAGGKLETGANLESVLTGLYIANRDQAKAYDRWEKRFKEECDAYQKELLDRVQAGELTKEEAAEAFEDKMDLPSNDGGFEWKDQKPYRQTLNLLVAGEPGGGKTSIIEKWAEQNNIGLVVKTAAEITQSVTRGLPYATDASYIDENGEERQKKVQSYLPSTFFSKLDDDRHKWNILFVDEINRMYPESEAGLLTLIQDRTVSDCDEPDGRHRFKKMLFTIAACNPPESSKEAHTLGMAMRTRFSLYIWNSDPEELREFITKDNNIRLKLFDDPSDPDDARICNEVKGRQRILDTIIDSGKFKFADPSEVKAMGDSKDFAKGFSVVNARTFMSALLACNGYPGADDTGNMKFPQNSFLAKYRSFCSQLEPEIKEMNDILIDLQNEIKDESEGLLNNLFGIYSSWLRRNHKRLGLEYRMS